MKFETVLHFWFEEIEHKAWFRKDPAFDAMLMERFGELQAGAAACELFAWRESARGRLAEVILLDQFSRNLFRDEAGAFAQDPLALALSQEAIANGAHMELTQDERTFFYMPYMHSESRPVHEVALTLFAEPGMEENFRYEQRHKAIIDQFGRYPHRNAVLGRESTAEEIGFLQQKGSSF